MNLNKKRIILVQEYWDELGIIDFSIPEIAKTEIFKVDNITNNKRTHDNFYSL